MRSKNQLPVQVILPQSQMSGNHSAPRGGFEEALQSSIEASLRSNGTAPSLRIFSLLYRQSKPQLSNNAAGTALNMFQNKVATDNGDMILDVKPDISDLNREISRHTNPSEDRGSIDDSHKTPSTRSSPKDHQNEGTGNYSVTSSRGPPPLLMPKSFVQPTTVTSSTSDNVSIRNSGNRQLMQRLPSIIPTNLQQMEQLKKAQEQVKQLQQLQKWRLLQQHQQARAAVANSLSQIPRLPFFNPLMPSSGLNRNALPRHPTNVNGVKENVSSTPQTSPGSPMFRKGYCKGGKDIRLSTLQQDGTLIAPYPVEYSLVALSISPSVPQVVKPSGGYHPPDIPAEGMVVVAINSMCLPPQQLDSTRPVLAQCIGCSDATLVSFATLASHINLRSAATGSNVNMSGVAMLQRHARHFVLREPNPPRACVRGAIIPWPVMDVTPPRDPSVRRQSVGAAPHARSGAPPSSVAMMGMQELLQPSKSSALQSGGVSVSHQGFMAKSQAAISHSFSPISDNSDNSSTRNIPKSEFAISSLPWNSTVKLPDCFPGFVGLPLILICWEWQQLQSNINNIHISRSFAKCFQEVLSSNSNSPVMPLTKEMCYFVVAQYLVSLSNSEFPIPSILSSWFARARRLFHSLPQAQVNGSNIISLVQVVLSNAQEKVGLVTSQKSQAHAINECISKLKPDGPAYHIIAHTNGTMLLDLSILLTGHASRLTREFLLSDQEELNLIEGSCTPEVFSEIDLKMQSLLTHKSPSLKAHHDRENSLIRSATQFLPSTSNVCYNRESRAHDELNRANPTSTSQTFRNQHSTVSDENLAIRSSHEDEAIANRLCEKLSSHVSSIFSESSTDMTLSHFSSIQCYFLLPPSPVAIVEVVADVTKSKLIAELEGLLTISSAVDERDIIITTEVSSNERVEELREQIEKESSTLFILFCTDSHIHCDKSSLGSEWISELLQHKNVLVFYSTYIPQALLNQNTSIETENIVLCETESQSYDDHCQHNEKYVPWVSYDVDLESRNLKISESLPAIHSSLIKAKIILSEYMSAIDLHRFNSHQTTGENAQQSSPLVTSSIIRSLLSSRKGATVLLRIPHECIAEKIADDLMDRREKLRMQNTFEIMLYSSKVKPYLSEYFLNVIRRSKNKSDDWKPETLSEIDCIPLILIYTGKILVTQSLPCNLSHIDLRLLGLASSIMTQSSLLAELSLVRLGSRIVFENTNKPREQPEEKKMKADSEDDALCMDTFSDDSSDGDSQLKWKSFDQKCPDQELRSKNNQIAGLTRKRKRDPSIDNHEQIGVRRYPTVILSKALYPYVLSHFKGMQKFHDLAPHRYTQWCHERAASPEEKSPTYFRKWTRPLQGSPDFEQCGAFKTSRDNKRLILLATSAPARVTYGCCLFVKQLNRTLKKLLQVEVYDYVSSAELKPNYPLPDADVSLRWPVYTAILDMDYDTSIVNGEVVKASRITNGARLKDLKTTPELPPIKSPCMVGKYPAHDISHRGCNSCKHYGSFTQMTTLHDLVLTNCFSDEFLGVDNDSLSLKFVIPHTEHHRFIFNHDNDGESTLQAINLCCKDHSGVKTPVFSLGIHGAHHGLYNLDHTFQTSTWKRSETNTDSPVSSGEPLHIIVVKHKDMAEYEQTWFNKILMVLPENFDDLSAGAMKCAIQCVMSQSVIIKQDQSRSLTGYSANEVWPFAMLVDDSVVMWTRTCQTSSENSQSNAIAKWQNVSLLEILERIESMPCVGRYAAIGFRRWSSRMSDPQQEENFSGDVMSSRFSKCHLSSCFVINTVSTKDDLFDHTKFLHEDVDWCIRIAASDMAVLRMNEVAFACKVLPLPEAEFASNPKALVNLADAKYNPIKKHPHHILETFLCHLGLTVFPRGKGNPNHPVLVVDRYISLGPEVFTEFACSKPGALQWAVNTEKIYSGLLLYCQSSEIPSSFLQQFKFLPGATVCVVGRDRSSLRQTVVNLHLENDWHFRLTDEYQTANDTSFRKPLFYLTGVSRMSR